MTPPPTAGFPNGCVQFPEHSRNKQIPPAWHLSTYPPHAGRWRRRARTRRRRQQSRRPRRVRTRRRRPTRSPGDFDGGGAPLEQHSEPRRPPAPWSGRRFAHGSPGPGLPPPPASHLTGAPQSTDWAPPAADTTPSRGSENCVLIDWRNTPPAVVGGGACLNLSRCPGTGAGQLLVRTSAAEPPPAVHSDSTELRTALPAPIAALAVCSRGSPNLGAGRV